MREAFVLNVCGKKEMFFFCICFTQSCYDKLGIKVSEKGRLTCTSTHRKFVRGVTPHLIFRRYWETRRNNPSTPESRGAMLDRPDSRSLALSHLHVHVEGSLLAPNIRKKAAALGGWSKLPLHSGTLEKTIHSYVRATRNFNLHRKYRLEIIVKNEVAANLPEFTSTANWSTDAKPSELSDRVLFSFIAKKSFHKRSCFPL